MRRRPCFLVQTEVLRRPALLTFVSVCRWKNITAAAGDLSRAYVTSDHEIK
jgi:hypothetical protein